MKKTLALLCVLALLVGTYVITVAAADSNAVAKIGDAGYDNIAEAIAQVDANDPALTIITLQESITDDLNVSGKTIYLDLNGCDIANVTGIGTLYCMDSKTDDYDATNDTGYGKITGTIANAVNVYGVPVGTVSTGDTETYPSGKLDGYLKVTENDDLSFHRVNLQLNSINLRTNKDAETNELNPSVYYTSAFAADAVVANLMKADPNNNTFGVALSVKDTDGLSSATELGADWKCSSFDATNFNAGNDTNATSTLLKGIMKESNPNLINQRNAKLKIYGCAYIRIGEQYMFGATDSRNLQEVMAGKTDTEGNIYHCTDSLWDTLEESEQDFVLKMYKTYKSIMKQWELTKIPAAFKSKEESIVRILNISNSHGQDSVWLLPKVFQAEREAGNASYDNFMVASCYFSGALTEHIANAKENAENYIYYTNTGDGWDKKEDVSISYALSAEHWDIIMFNESSRHLGLESKMSQDLIGKFRKYILNNLDYEPEQLLYNMTWSNPTDLRFHDNTDRQKPPATFKNTYTKDYGFDYVNHYNKLVELTKKYLVDHQGFDKIIYNATPIQYAQVACDVPQYDPEQKWDLYRDYTHLSDFARLIVAYQWYAQMFGVEELTAINVDVVEWENRATWNNRNEKLGDLEITPAHKEVIMASVNHTLQYPLTIETPATAE